MSDPVFYKKPSTMPDASEVGAQIVPALAGGVNQLAFGLPESILKSVGGDKVRQIVEEYKAKNPGYGAGEIAGGVGSMFIPGGALLKGAGKLAEGAPVLGKALTGLGEIAGGKLGLGQGVVAGLEQAVPRAVSEVFDTGDLGQAGNELALGAGVGGGVGYGLKKLGKLAETVKPYVTFDKPLKEARETASESILGNIVGITRKDIAPLVKGSASFNKMDDMDEIYDGAADLLDSGPQKIRNMNQVEKLVGDEGVLWKPFKDAYNSVSHPRFSDKIDEYMDDPGIFNTLDTYSGGSVEPLGELKEVLRRLDIRKDSDKSIGDWSAHRGKLNDIIKDGIDSPPDTRPFIQAKLALGIKSKLDDSAVELADPNLLGDLIEKHLPKRDFEKFVDAGKDPNVAMQLIKDRWPSIKLLESAAIRQKMRLSATSQPESKTAMSQALQGANPVTSVVNALGGGLVNRGANEFSKMMSTEGASKLRSMIDKDAGYVFNPESKGLKTAIDMGRKAGSKLSELLNTPTAQGIGAKLGPLLPTSAQHLGGPLAEANKSDVAPDMAGVEPTELNGDGMVEQMPLMPSPVLTGQPQDIQLMKTGQINDKAQQQDMLETGLEKAWSMEDPNGMIEQQNPGAKEQFKQTVRKGLTKADGSVDMLRAGKAIFPGDPESQSALRKGYEAYSIIQKNLPDAVKIVAMGTADNNKKLFAATVSNILTKDGEIGSKEAEGIVTGILNTPLLSPAEKKKQIMDLLKGADSFTYGEGGVLDRAGVLK